MPAPEWEIEFYEENGRELVLDFLRGLDELKESSSSVFATTRRRSCASLACRVPKELEDSDGEILLRVV